MKHENVDDNESKFIFTDELQKALKLHTGYLRGREKIRDWINGNLNNAGLPSTPFSDMKMGRSVSKYLLVRLLIYLQKNTDFDRAVFDEDWSQLTPDQLANRFICVAGKHKEMKRDIFSEGPDAVTVILKQALFEEVGNPVGLSDIEVAARTFAIGAGDLLHFEEEGNTQWPPIQDSLERSEEIIKLSKTELLSFFSAANAYNPNALWIYRKPNIDKSLVSMVLPIDEKTYRQFTAGKIDDVEIVHRPACNKSNIILIAIISGELRYRSPWASFVLMSMVLRQIGSMTKNINKHGLKLVSFQCTGLVSDRLSSYGFELKPKAKMKRTGYPILKLNLGKIMSTDKTAMLWVLVAMHQLLSAGSSAVGRVLGGFSTPRSQRNKTRPGK